MLERELGPGVAEALARSADLLRRDADALDGWAADAHSRAAADDPAGASTSPSSRDCRPPYAPGCCDARRADAGAPATDLTAGHVAELDRLVTDWRGQGPLQLPGAVVAARACGRLTLSRQPRSSR